MRFLLSAFVPLQLNLMKKEETMVKEKLKVYRLHKKISIVKKKVKKKNKHTQRVQELTKPPHSFQYSILERGYGANTPPWGAFEVLNDFVHKKAGLVFWSEIGNVKNVLVSFSVS